MDDDIDIEEHDLLDNPKIRDIFPDLSLVKTEVLNEELHDVYENSQEYNPDLQYNENNIKQEYVHNDENTNLEQNDNIYHEQTNQSESFVQSALQFEQSELPLEQNESFEQSELQLEQSELQLEQSESFEQSESSNQSGQSEILYPNDQNIIEYNELNEVNSNKIIIGTKPNRYDTLYQEALHSNVKIHLENWTVKLQNSLCYCNKCEILFPTVNALDAHNSTSHSFLVALERAPNTARKSTVATSSSSTYCNHCDKTFPSDTALITHLYELLPLNDFQKPPPTPVKVVKNEPCKCIMCKKVFNCFTDGSRHKKLAHPTLSHMNLIVRVSDKTEKEFSEVNKNVVPKRPGKLYYSTHLVPKSVLFQCNICHINFVSCYSTLQHSRKCENKTLFIKCKICKRKIRSIDLPMHEKQHKYSEKLKIYMISASIYEKVLLKCPKCEICFDEKVFWIHEKSCDGRQTGHTHCNICRLDIFRYAYHKRSHSSKKYTKKDYIIVEFINLNSKQSTHKLKVKTLPVSDTNLYYCGTCGSYKNIFSHHGHGKDVCNTLSKNIKFCDVCGLGFGRYSYVTHKTLHTTKKLTLTDFKIYSLATGEPIETPMSNFHQCEFCKMHFLAKEALASHTCETDKYEICEICDKKFSTKAYGPHTNFHTAQGLPELIKKYNSINNMWNVVYMCVFCELVTLTYDSAVEHCQNHINNIENTPEKFCEKCDFKILPKYHKQHMVLHENNDSLNRDEFIILKYNYNHIYTKNWMNILAPLSKQHKYQILTRSIYRYTRRIKLNCEINCLTDDVKLFCKRCKTAVNMKDMKVHYFAKDCKYSTKYICHTCHLKFKTLHECVLHEEVHDNTPKKYKIITYNDQKDELFDQRLKYFEMKPFSGKEISNSASGTPKSVKFKSLSLKRPNKSGSVLSAQENCDSAIGTTNSVKEISAKKSLSLKRSKIGLKKSGMHWKLYKQTVRYGIEMMNRFKLYRCEKCRSCVSIKRNISSHKCMGSSKQKRCHICNEFFICRYLNSHMNLHKSFPKIIQKPLVINFKPKTSLSSAIVFQCECGLNFTSKQSIDKHLNVCTDNLVVSKETCSKCNLVFPTNVLVSHLCKHHSKPVDINITIIKRTQKGPYKCTKCKVIYPNLTNYEEHLFKCPVKTAKICSKCNFLIDQKHFETHVCNQNITQVNYNGRASEVVKCPSCNITYLYKKSYAYHELVKHVNHREIRTCVVCTLRFTSNIWDKHTSVIHDDSENFIVKVVDPDTNDFNIIKGRNFKLDIMQSNTKNADQKPSPKKVVQSISPKKVDQSISPKKVDQKITPAKVDQKITPAKVDQKITPKNDFLTANAEKTSFSTIYKCTKCNLCYLTRRRWHYHKANNNHISKRTVVSCKICALRFTVVFISNHMEVHRKGEYYSIEVREPDTNKISTIYGKNRSNDSVEKRSKRKSRTESDIKSKRAKIDKEIDDNSEISNSNIGDSSLRSRRSKRNISFDDQVPSTSRIGFESVTMGDNDTFLELDNTGDPLNDSAEIVPGDNLSETKNISTKLKNLLDSNLQFYSNSLYKCTQCSLHFLTSQSVLSHVDRDCRPGNIPACKCTICGFEFTSRTLQRHVYIHHTVMALKKEHFHVEFLPEDMNSSENQKLEKSIHKKMASNEGNPKIFYYKCGDCNVCFIDENSCKKHCLSHSPLDPKSYIECKICNFQFLIEYLKKHVNIHHNSEFCIEDLVIHEYTNTGDRIPIVNRYRGIDKVQSRLISTTTDGIDDIAC